jgi:hypothetical protein
MIEAKERHHIICYQPLRIILQQQATGYIATSLSIINQNRSSEPRLVVVTVVCCRTNISKCIYKKT